MTKIPEKMVWPNVPDAIDWPAVGTAKLLRPRGMSDYSRIYRLTYKTDNGYTLEYFDYLWTASYKSVVTSGKYIITEAFQEFNDRMQAHESLLKACGCSPKLSEGVDVTAEQLRSLADNEMLKPLIDMLSKHEGVIGTIQAHMASDRSVNFKFKSKIKLA